MRFIFLAVLIGVLGVSSGAPVLLAQNPAADAFVRKVDDHYNHLASLRAHYTEHYSGMGMDRTETGTLLLKKPGRMRWTYDKPAGKLFVLNGKYAWSYTPGDTQATRIAAKQIDDLRSPLRFLLGHTELKKELDGLSVTPAGLSYKVSGVPKGMAQRIKLLALTVAVSGTIEDMRLEELDGSTTEFTFTAIEENVPVRDSDFTFTAPPGVSVTDGLPPI